MPDNVINKVVFEGRTLVDLTDTTATAETILSGYGAYGADGVWVDGTATAGSLSGHVWQDNEGYIHLDDDGGDMYITTPLNVTTNGTYTAPTGVAYTPVSVQVPQGTDLPILTIHFDSNYDIDSVTCNKTYAECVSLSIDDVVDAIVQFDWDGSFQESTYGATGAYDSYNSLIRFNVADVNYSYCSYVITYNSNNTLSVVAHNTKESGNMTVSGATVTAEAGYYPYASSKSVASGTAGTPTATKGAVSNHAVTVTPSVTNTTGYITGSTKTGTGVQVTASELASGNKAITENGDNIDVVGYSTVSVAVPSSAPTHTATISGTGASSTCRAIYNNTFYYTDGATFTYSAGDTITLSCIGQRMNAYVYIDGTLVKTGSDTWASYEYTAPDHDIEIQLTYSSDSYIRVVFPTISITTNGNKQDVHEYYYADVDVQPTYTAHIWRMGSGSRPNVQYNSTYYYTNGNTFEFHAGDTLRCSLRGEMADGALLVDGVNVSSGAVPYNYTLPASDIYIDLNSSVDGSIYISTSSFYVSGIEIETGVWEPEEDTFRGEILFSNNHAREPLAIFMVDTNTSRPASYSNGAFEFHATMFQNDNSTFGLKATVATQAYANAGWACDSQECTFTGNTNETYVGYWATSSRFYPQSAYTSSQVYYWRAGRSYKWLAIWPNNLIVR